MYLLECREEMLTMGKVSSKPFLSNQVKLFSFVRNTFQLGSCTCKSHPTKSRRYRRNKQQISSNYFNIVQNLWDGA